MSESENTKARKQIKEIVVTGLFGSFNHVIPLNQDERITIIHGLNGYGKTVILKILYAISHSRMSSKFSSIANIPFDSYEVELLEGGIFRLSKLGVHLDLEWASNKAAPFFSAISEIRKFPEISFVGTERLASKGKQPFAVAEHSMHLKNLIKHKLAQFGELSQKLDSSFPARYIKKMGKNGVSGEKVKTQLDAIERRRERFVRAGILSADTQAMPMPAHDFDENALDVLSIYAEDSKAKLDVLEDTVSRVELLLDIINRRFRFKTMSIDDGYCFKDQKGQKFGAEALSTGEQHQLVMWYRMLFDIQPGTLVLIDEPELSLHISWAREFIKDLQAVAKLSDIHVLLATHSPDLIHDRWDLTVELKGPEAP